MTSLGEFLDMGGYGIFVWPAFLSSLVVLAANLVIAWCQKQQQLKRLRRTHNSK